MSRVFVRIQLRVRVRVRVRFRVRVRARMCACVCARVHVCAQFELQHPDESNDIAGIAPDGAGARFENAEEHIQMGGGEEEEEVEKKKEEEEGEETNTNRLGQAFHVAAALLTSSSPVFASLLSTKGGDNNMSSMLPAQIRVNRFNAEDVRVFLDLLVLFASGQTFCGYIFPNVSFIPTLYCGFGRELTFENVWQCGHERCAGVFCYTAGVAAGATNRTLLPCIWYAMLFLCVCT